jgi:type IV secretory pathway VirB2 component (pilin)
MQFEISFPTIYAILLAVAVILIIAVSFALILGRKNAFKRKVQA